MTHEELDLAESILYVLLNGSRSNDANRWFAGLRKPSKLTRQLMDDISDNCEKRKML